MPFFILFRTQVQLHPVARYQLGETHKSLLIAPEELFMQDDPVGFLKSVERYVDIHRHLFGTYEGELFQRPSEEIVKSAS